MTVISTTISSLCTVHVTDSLMRQRIRGAGNFDYEQGYKFAKVSAFAGAMSWFGRIYHDPWDAVQFLHEMSASASDFAGRPDDFALAIAERLNLDHGLLQIRGQVAMGVHFSFYEEVADAWIPEMLFITNYTGITDIGEYVIGQDFVPQRQTFFTLTKDQDFDKHRQPENRLVVNHLLRTTQIEYNNGNPFLYNALSGGTNAAARHFVGRLRIDVTDPILLQAKTAQLKVEAVADFQEKLVMDQHRLVGRPCHYLAILPDGSYRSDISAADIPGT